ncbi:hypothetical protein HN587_01485 [Candidatus Woesearchaeota archaeon]|jgi:hypothetical protein|nr:hypothetical protein [Candidatus Woesearchaeota archaeon]
MKKADLEQLVQEMAQDFVDNWSRFKYEPKYSLMHFSASWNKNEKRLDHDPDFEGDYFPVLDAAIDLAKTLFEEEYVPPRTGFSFGRKRDLIANAAANEAITNMAILDMLPTRSDLTREVTNIQSGKYIATEAAQKFIDAYETHRTNTKYNVLDFLKYYDANTDSFRNVRSKDKGTYCLVYLRLEKEHGENWLNTFYDMVDDPILSERVKLIQEETDLIVSEEDKIRFCQKIAQYGVIGLVESMDVISYDYLTAMFGEEVFTSKDREVLERMRTCKKFEGPDREGGLVKGIRFYLGRCKTKRASDDTIYDWKTNLAKKVLEKAKKRIVIDADLLLQRRLRRNQREKWQPYFDNPDDRAEVFELLQTEITDAQNPALRDLLKSTYTYFDRVYNKLPNTDGVRNQIPVTRVARK